MHPFVRAAAVSDASVYWAPVDRFPMLPPQREWMLEFHRRLAQTLMKKDLREECFLQFKSLYPHLLDRFTTTSGNYMPMVGAGLFPGKEPQPVPDFNAIKEQVENAQRHGTPVDVNRWIPDQLQWFLKKYADKQRRDFFGHGGMLTLYLPKDKATVAPKVDMPRYVRTMPGSNESEMNAEVAAAYSLKDAFLKKSKERFGQTLEQDPTYKGLMFVLPLLTCNSLIEAEAEQRVAWFDVFDGYLIESRVDRGVILALKDADFDDALMDLVEGMRDDGLTYRS